MTTSADEIARIAALAQLRLDPEELERMSADLTEILAYVEQLAGLDLEVAEPAGAQVDWPAPERRSDLAVDPLLEPPAAQAPDWREGFFVVPRLPALEGTEEPGDAGPGEGSAP